MTLVLAVINIGVAVLAHPTGEALAEVPSNQVAAGVGIQAGVAFALIGVDEAGLAAPLEGTGALEAVDLVLAGAPMATGVGETLVHIDTAGGATPAGATLALEALTGLHTAPSVETGLRQTGMLCFLAVDTRVAVRTGTVVLVRSSVAAGPHVLTGLERTTCVQVFVAELAAKVCVTEALPWFHAGSVHTARVRDALITVLALPAVQTLAISGQFTGTMFSAAALPANSSAAF